MNLKEMYVRSSPLAKAITANIIMSAIFLLLMVPFKTPTVESFLYTIGIAGFFAAIFGQKPYSPPLWLHLLGKLGQGLIGEVIAAGSAFIVIFLLAVFKIGPFGAILSLSILCTFIIHAAIDGVAKLKDMSWHAIAALTSINFFFFLLLFYLPYRYL